MNTNFFKLKCHRWITQFRGPNLQSNPERVRSKDDDFLSGNFIFQNSNLIRYIEKNQLLLATPIFFWGGFFLKLIWGDSQVCVITWTTRSVGLKLLYTYSNRCQDNSIHTTRGSRQEVPKKYPHRSNIFYYKICSSYSRNICIINTVGGPSFYSAWKHITSRIITETFRVHDHDHLWSMVVPFPLPWAPLRLGLRVPRPPCHSVIVDLDNGIHVSTLLPYVRCFQSDRSSIS